MAHLLWKEHEVLTWAMPEQVPESAEVVADQGWAQPIAERRREAPFIGRDGR